MKFDAFNLPQWLLQSLQRNNFIQANEIQSQAFLPIKQNKNVLISAPTGCGKTLAYLLPVLNNLKTNVKFTQYLIIVPTKELSWQISNVCKKITSTNKNVQIACLDAKKELPKQNNHQIIISTVGRVSQLLQEAYDFSHLQSIVFDEADMLLDCGFELEIDYLFKKFDARISKIIVSASLDQKTQNIFQKNISNLQIISLQKNIYDHNNIIHHLVYQKDNSQPMETLMKLLNIIHPYLAMIFANTKKQSNEIYQKMLTQGYNVTLIHKDLPLHNRKQAIQQINKNRYQYIICSDLLSRGMDFSGVTDVISFNLPQDDLWYLHRAGRTGRNKKTGNSYVIFHQNDKKQILRLEQKNVKWKYCLLSQGQLIEKKTKKLNKPIITNPDLKKEINKLYNSKTKKVQPGYKKKIKQKIYKIKQKSKREYITSQIRKKLNRRSQHE